MTKCASDSITHWFKSNIEDIVAIDETISDWEYTLTSIRNPFDRLVSSYKHFASRNSIPAIMQCEELNSVKGNYPCSFSKYVDRVVSLAHPKILTDAETRIKFRNQAWNPDVNYWEYTLRLHTIPMTHPFCDARRFTDIIRFENLEKDWEIFLNKYGMPYLPLGNQNKGHTGVYWKHYDRKTRDIVADYYKEDLLTFNYKF
jgi:hypothetical protein